MRYEHKIRKKPLKFILRQDKIQQKRLLGAIDKLPLEGDIKRMAGFERVYRLRVGDYRVLYELNDKGIDIIEVDVFDADNRGQIYKQQ